MAGWVDELFAVIKKRQDEFDSQAKLLSKAATDRQRLKDVQAIVDRQIALEKELRALAAKVPAAQKLDAEAMQRTIRQFVL